MHIPTRARNTPQTSFLSALALGMLAVFALPGSLHAQTTGYPVIALITPDSETTEISGREQTAFSASVVDDATSAPMITTLRFTITDERDTVVFTRDDQAPPYCAVDGFDGCAPLEPSIYATLEGHELLLSVETPDLTPPSILTWPLSIVGLNPATSDLSSDTTDADSSALDQRATLPDATTDTTSSNGMQLRWVVPEAGALITRREETAFMFSAFDPAVGSADGSGIARVTLQLLRGTTQITARSENTAAYCAFGGNVPCLLISKERLR